MSEYLNKVVDGVVIPLTAEETQKIQNERAAWAAGADDRAAAEVRKQRDKKLSATDWRASSDLTLSTEWAAYRQALRDVPTQEGFPHNIIWPTEPDRVLK